MGLRDNIHSHYGEDEINMEISEDIDQFQLLEQKIDALLALVATLKKEKSSLAEKAQIQEERLADISEELEGLRSSRDKAKQRIVSLLEKIEQMGV
jgi:uncharacterized coiled-coil DUF342 family protein